MQLTRAVLTLTVATSTASALPAVVLNVNENRNQGLGIQDANSVQGQEPGHIALVMKNPVSQFRDQGSIRTSVSNQMPQLQQSSIENGEHGMWAEASVAGPTINAAASERMSKTQQIDYVHQAQSSKDNTGFVLNVRRLVEPFGAQGRESVHNEQQANQQQDEENLARLRQGRSQAQMVPENLGMGKVDHHSGVPRQGENSDEVSTTISAASFNQEGRQSMLQEATAQGQIDNANYNQEQENILSDAARSNPIYQEIAQVLAPQMREQRGSRVQSRMVNSATLIRQQEQQRVEKTATGQNNSQKQQQEAQSAAREQQQEQRQLSQTQNQVQAQSEKAEE